MLDIKEMANNEIDSLIEELNKATEAYDKGKPIMSDEEWDNKYFELANMEKFYNYYNPKSPTQSIHFAVVSKLKKVKHVSPMLSLDKTKEINELVEFAGDKDVICMCKMDGLSLRLTYEKGILTRAETRGDGIEGEDVTHNAKVISSIPKTLWQDMETAYIDGEIICRYDDFEEFKSEDYKNPRNFAAGSIRLLASEEANRRKLTFVAWDITYENDHLTVPMYTRLNHLETVQGFNVTPYYLIEDGEYNFEKVIDNLKGKAEILGYPIDGIVVKYDDREYGESLGATAHHKKDAIAYKFYDEEYETNLIRIEYEPSRNGILTPVAVFEPIEIDGTTVEKSTLHNWTVMTDTLGDRPYKGQRIWVCKKNQIIPQITRAEKENTENAEIVMPLFECPCCNGAVDFKKTNNSVFLVCANPNCLGKEINKIDYYCSTKGMNIKGLSKMTISKLLDWGWISNITDIYKLERYKDEWINKTGFGKASVGKIFDAIEQSKNCELSTFIAALGIPFIGKNVAIELAKHLKSYDDLRDKIKRGFDFTSYSGFGEKIDISIKNYDYTYADEIAKLLILTNTIKEETAPVKGKATQIVQNENGLLSGKTIVITGKLQYFRNRDALAKKITQMGGKVTSAISSKTSFLINNDLDSTSTKNKRARELGIQILSEENFMKIYLT